MIKRILAASLLLLALLLLPATAKAQEGGPIYIVQSGDTLSAIARTFGATVDSLMEANNLNNANDLQPGQQLVLPGFAGVEGVLTTQQIRFGETLELLAQRYRADPEGLARLNRVLHPGRLYVGQSIILPEPAAEEGVARPSLRPYLVPADQGLLRFAAGSGINPWQVALQASSRARLWWVPGEWATVTSQLPDPPNLPAPVEHLEVSPLQAVQGETTVVRL